MRLGRRLDHSRDSIEGPTKDSRRQYLHARADEMRNLISKPLASRASTELDRLGKALALRELINDKYRAEGVAALRTCTLQSILDLAGAANAAQTA